MMFLLKIEPRCSPNLQHARRIEYRGIFLLSPHTVPVHTLRQYRMAKKKFGSNGLYC